MSGYKVLQKVKEAYIKKKSVTLSEKEAEALWRYYLSISKPIKPREVYHG